MTSGNSMLETPLRESAAALETPLRESAASHMVTEIPRATADMTANAVIQSLQGRNYECADTVFVTNDKGQLSGIVRINELFAADDRLIGDIMEPKHAAVRCGDDQEQIAMLAIDLSMIAVPVVDDENQLIGAVPPESLFRILRNEHMEDLQRIAGITAHQQRPNIALTAPLLDRIHRRLPWLVFGLLASSIVTIIMAGAEQTLSTNIAVVYFVPALVYITGAIGNQAVSVAVRGLSSGDVSIRRLLHDELITGLAIGVVLGLISAILAYLPFGDAALALAVGLAVLLGGTVSAVVGFGLPWTFRHFGFDPALGSGPICTIIQDAVSLSTYVALVSILIS